jgi:hypothetical protein
MKKRLATLLCLSIMIPLLVLGFLSYHLFGDREGHPSPDGTRVTLVLPAGDRDAPPSPGDMHW